MILLRPTETNGFEVFLTRRRDEMAFLGGKYCFPGGALRHPLWPEAADLYVAKSVTCITFGGSGGLE